MTERGTLFIVSGPSGVGKGTLLSEMFGRYNLTGLMYSISMTTRKARNSEREAVDYYFVDDEKFEELIQNNGFLEYNNFCNGRYGTPAAPVEKALSEGSSVVLEIEPNGMRNVRNLYPDAIKIFIAPPSMEVLDQRIRDRKTETEEQRKSRLDAAHREINAMGEYDFVVVNDSLHDAARELAAIFKKFLKSNENAV